jgi:hypothetical protein
MASQWYVTLFVTGLEAYRDLFCEWVQAQEYVGKGITHRYRGVVGGSEGDVYEVSSPELLMAIQRLKHTYHLEVLL